MNKTDNSKNQGLIVLEESFAIALLTVSVYAAFLLKEIGYARVFAIPLDVISTREVGLALTAEAFLFGVLSYAGKVNLIWILAPKSDGLIAIVARRFIAISLLIGFALYPYLATGLSIWWLVGPLIFFLFFTFLWPLITQRGISDYEDKMAAQLVVDRNSNGDIVNSVLKLLGRQWHITFFVMVAMMAFAYGLGRKEAIEQSSFFAVDGRPGWFVLKIYNDLVVTALVNVKQKQLAGEIELTKLAEGNSLRLRRVEIGPFESSVAK